MTDRPAALIAELGLMPHPEGGHYREVFRSTAIVHTADDRGERSSLTTIYFLLVAGQTSRWHRVLSDEAWHYYEGDPLELFWMDADTGVTKRGLLGPATGEQRPVHVVPAGWWQAARPRGAYTLVGCTVGPGFDFADFTMAGIGSQDERTLHRQFGSLDVTD